MWADPKVVEYISGKPSTREMSFSRLLRYAGHWELLDYGYWVIEDRETGRFIGEAGFADYRREITPSMDGMPELGWALVPSAHGKGLATEAVSAAIAWGREHFGAGRTIACIVSPENVASVRVAEKAGFTLKTTTQYLGSAVLMYTLTL